MKNLILALILFFPMILLAEYNGIHIEFELQLKNGIQVKGYKYLAHGENNLAFKAQLERSPDVFLKNHSTVESGEYVFYQKRLQYDYEGYWVYQLIEPVKIDFNEIKTVVIKELITASYAIQLTGNYLWEDRHWMNTTPIAKYIIGEEMCTNDVFIHNSGVIPLEDIEEIKLIIHQIDIKIKSRAKELENIINSDQEYVDQMQSLYEERKQLLAPYFKKYKSLQTVIVTMCTC
jgi:hypothetical protein